MQKFRNPMRVLPLPHGTEPLDPFDEYVNIDRIVEGRAPVGDTASVKVRLTKSKRKRSGRSKRKENDDGEDFDTSDDDDPSDDDYTGDPGPSTKLSKLKNIQRHSHQIRGQGRQTNRNPSSQLTSKSQRTPSIRKNPTRGASKKHAVQGQNSGYVLPFSGYQISGPANNERDYANGDQPCGSNPLAPPEYSVVKMEDCINTESHGVKRRQDFEQSPHRDQGSYLQEVNDATTQQGGKEKRRRLGQHEIDQVGSVKSTILRSPVLRGSRNHGRPRGRRNGRLQSPSGMSSHNNISNSPLSSPITTSLTSDSLSSRDSLSSSYSLSLMTETEGPGEDGSLHADIPSNADDANPECKREQESDSPLHSTGDERLETRGEDGDGSSSFSSYHPSLSSTQSSLPSEHLATNQVYEFQHDGIIPLQDSTESHIRFMSSNALQHNGMQTPQLETPSIGTPSGLGPLESPSQPISASGSIYSAATTPPVIDVVYPLPTGRARLQMQWKERVFPKEPIAQTQQE
ncbi:hypothetical protein B0O80DRAFT_431941 [Mortierella sp. GBAus27b]|nr:hypothetical protein B0O80DRAFT_431941 [Mortierella sp. GBAus27b]